MAFTPITDSQIQVGKPIKKSLWQRVKDNFDDINDRIISLDTSSGSISVWEETLRDLNQGIGQVISSPLTVVEFQKLNGTHWVQCNGQSITGSYLHSSSGLTNAPDYRGQFLRGWSDGLTNDLGRGLNTSQAGQMPSHTHTTNAAKKSTSSATNAPGGTAFGDFVVENLTITSSTAGGTENSNEVRPINYSTNFFIQINPAPRIGVLYFQAKVAFNLNLIKITNLNQSGYTDATAGTCTIDIKKGDLTTMTSIFTTKPIISATTNGSQNAAYVVADGEELVAAGEWLQLNIDSLFPNQQMLIISVDGVPVA